MRQGPGTSPPATDPNDLSSSRPSEAHHTVDVQLGAVDAPAPPRRRKRGPRRSPALRVVERIPTEQPVRWEPRPGLPAGGRAECRHGERPCPHIQCRYHLWRVDEPAGRPWHGKPPPTMLPAWLELPTPPCCALDIADAVDAGATDYATVPKIASAMHLGLTRVHEIITQAKAKLRSRGVELADLLAAMAELAARRDEFTIVEAADVGASGAFKRRVLVR